MKRNVRSIITISAITLLILGMHSMALATTEPGDGAPGGGQLPSAPTGTEPGMTVSKPPIIPTGTNTQTAPSTNPGEIDISTLKLPGVGYDNGQLLQETVLPQITNIVIGLTAGLALLFVIVSGIQILTAYGNEEKIGVAKKTLTWALIGLLISILSYAIVQIIVSIKIV